MKLENLNDLFIEELRDLYSAENQIIEALPKMAEKAANPKLKKAFEMHLRETEKQAARLEKIFDKLDVTTDSHTCKAMKGIIAEGEQLMKKNAEESVMDAALIAAAQKVEHYEIASYGTARTFAEQLGLNDAANLLGQTLDEEKNADTKLTDIAESIINVKAMNA
jgi:ferritin-like metal-binding protein YciE